MFDARKIALGLALSAALVTPAFAQLGAAGDGYTLFSMQANGMMTMVQIDKAIADQLMAHAKPLPNTMILEHGGKAWLVEDMKMTNGQMAWGMLTREQRGW